ncbi:hypothetical protein Salat_0769900 [Sesamum alatum]|uniref:Uncharacterized protein n=1 Tax=Sesamum alatum TaxID=300844 RepID=A0AAE1YTU7_9LAMI|nr:hypothetical protein Salat_0769900 [Sesamum alatum]
MPSVGMRRTTRVFGARVLRSGRRLWRRDAGDHRKDMWQEIEKRCFLDMTAEARTARTSIGSMVEEKNLTGCVECVYKRKRTRTELGPTEDKRYGKKFVRKQWRKKSRATESFEICGDFWDSVSRSQELAIVVNGSSYDYGYWDSITAKNPGTCIISGSRSLTPLISVDFPSIPSFFVRMQTSMHLRSAHLACLLVAHSWNIYENDEEVTDLVDDAEETSFQNPWRDHRDCISVASQISPERDISYTDAVASGNDNSESQVLSHSAIGLPKSALRNLQLRNSRNIQKRRSSLRRKRGRPPSAFRAQKANGALSSDFFRARTDAVQLSAAAPSRFT